MSNAWRKYRSSKALSPKSVALLLFSSSLLAVLIFLLAYRSSNRNPSAIRVRFTDQFMSAVDCMKCPQAYPVIANRVEGLKFPFIYSLADLGKLPDKPQKDIVRTMKGKLFRKPDISSSIQHVLEGVMKKNVRKDGVVVDVGANVGMATFAAAVMGFKVLAFEPVLENIQRICDGVFLNRVSDLVTIFNATVSDHRGHITFHKLVGRLDNSAISAEGAKMKFKSNEEVKMLVESVRLDDVLSESEPVVLLKVDVQGWEYHVLRGASRLLSRNGGDEPYLIYEEDEGLLQASNSSAKQIRDFLRTVGYDKCTQRGTDVHCTKSA